MMATFFPLSLFRAKSTWSCACVVRGNGPEEVGVVAALGELHVGGRRRHGDDLRLLVHAERRLGRAAADVAENHGRLLGHQLGADVGRDLGLAHVVFREDDDLLAEHAALGVHVADHELGRIQRRQAVGCQVSAVRPRDAELYRVSGKGLSGEKHAYTQHQDDL